MGIANFFCSFWLFFLNEIFKRVDEPAWPVGRIASHFCYGKNTRNNTIPDQKPSPHPSLSYRVIFIKRSEASKIKIVSRHHPRPKTIQSLHHQIILPSKKNRVLKFISFVAYE